MYSLTDCQNITHTGTEMRCCECGKAIGAGDEYTIRGGDIYCPACASAEEDEG